MYVEAPLAAAQVMVCVLPERVTLLRTGAAGNVHAVAVGVAVRVGVKVGVAPGGGVGVGVLDGPTVGVSVGAVVGVGETVAVTVGVEVWHANTWSTIIIEEDEMLGLPMIGPARGVIGS